MEKLIITAAITGSRITRDITPHIPLTPDEIVEAAQNGAHIIGLSILSGSHLPLVQDCLEKQGGSQILVGSSMGVWIAIQLALANREVVAGILGIAAAPDFTLDIWDQLTAAQRSEMVSNGLVLLPSEYSEEPYPISQHLIEDSKQWLLLERRQSAVELSKDLESDGSTAGIELNCPVRLVHGKQDIDVPWTKSLRLADAITTDDVQITLIKSGDHRLSGPRDLGVILRLLEDLLQTLRLEQP